MLLTHSPVASPEVCAGTELSGLGCAAPKAKEKPPTPPLLCVVLEPPKTLALGVVPEPPNTLELCVVLEAPKRPVLWVMLEPPNTLVLCAEPKEKLLVPVRPLPERLENLSVYIV